MERRAAHFAGGTCRSGQGAGLAHGHARRQLTATGDHVCRVLAIDRALTSLSALNARLSQLVELRFFAGLTDEETAEVMGTSERTVRRDWRKARAYLFQALGGQAAG